MSMAKQLVDEEFWLPSDILCDEFFHGGDKGGGEGKGGLAGAGLRGELPFAFDSNLSSPVESVTETEGSDEEEDLMAELTKQMTRFFLPDDGKGSYTAKAAERSKDDSSRTMARSPQSTLCAWLASSNKGSPNGPSVVSSPPTSSSPLERLDKAADSGNLLYEAAGQVMRLHLNGLSRGEGPFDRGILGAPSKSTHHVVAAPKNASADYYAPSPVLSALQIQAAHFYHLRRQQIIKQQLSAAWGRQIKGRHGGEGFGESGCVCLLDLSPSAWPPLRKPSPAQEQQPPPPPPGSGMRAVFLHSTASRKESSGTGVFLPRTAGSKLEPKKKTGCSTVLVPDRVVQALNLNLEEFAAQPRFPGGFVLSHDALVGRSNASLSNQKRNHYNLNPRAATTTPIAAASPPELGLPQEWIY